MGPLFKMLNLIGGAVGRKVGKRVVEDTEAINKLEGWTQAQKIKELAADKELSKTYLESLIKQSRSKEDLKAIIQYLNNKENVWNLSPQTVNGLFRKVASSWQQAGNSEALKELIKSLKDEAF